MAKYSVGDKVLLRTPDDFSECKEVTIIRVDGTDVPYEVLLPNRNTIWILEEWVEDLVKSESVTLIQKWLRE